MKRARVFFVVLVFMCLLLYEAFDDSQNDISNHVASDKVEQNVEEEIQEDADSQKTETPSEKINVGTVNVATHTPIAEQAYYQYHSLNNSEQAIYQAIVQAIKDSDTLVNLGKYSCSQNMLSKIYECIMADYPQFFYLAKNSSYICDSKGKNIKQLILMYTDGTTTDQYNEQGERTVTADRTIIAEQIRNFNTKISEVAATIPVSGSELEKEKIIYDFIQSNVVYDMQAATLVHNPKEIQVPHAYDVYGALCEGNAVCEGYAKLFQYLCNCVGIDATVVYGTSSGQPHMWNAVKIGNEWYMCDVTWDDCGRDDLHCYSYFNITTNQITEEHTIDTAYLQIPSCHSEACAFYNQYALYISDMSVAPSNYQQVLDNLEKNGDKYLCIYIGNQSEVSEDYLATHILSRDSDVQQYISSMNYAITLDNQYITAGKYGYIPLK